MRARRVLNQAKQTLDDDLSDLGQALHNLSQSIAGLFAAQAEMMERRLVASLYLARRRFDAWLEENAPWVGDARREPRLFWNSVGIWGDTIAIAVGLIVLMIYAPVIAALVTAAALSIGVGIAFFYTSRFGVRLRAPSYRAELRRRWALVTWRVRARLHATLRTADRWIHSVPGLSRRPAARA